MDKRGKSIYAFVDAANLFYGGERSLHWKIDYEKLIKFLREKFSVTKVFYYAGVDVDQYKEEKKEIDLVKLVKYYEGELLKKDRTDEEMVLLETHLKRANFYRDLDRFGYELRIKPTKVFTSTEGTVTTKANCDVDLTFDMMRFMSQYNEAVVMSGDGDFAPILEYLKNKKKKIRVLARAERTAREMKEIGGDDFIDFKSIRKEVEAEKIEKVGGVARKSGAASPRTPSVKGGRTRNGGRRNDGNGNKGKQNDKVMPQREERKHFVKKVPVFRKGF